MGLSSSVRQQMARNKPDDELNLPNRERRFTIENLVTTWGTNLRNGIMFRSFLVEIFTHSERFWNIFILTLITSVSASFGGFWTPRNIYKFNIITPRWRLPSHHDAIPKSCDAVVFFGDSHRKHFAIYKKLPVCIAFRVYLFHFASLGTRWYRRKPGNSWTTGNCCK